MGPKSGKLSFVAVKKVTTTCDFRSGEATSKYHHSGLVALTGWSFGASSESRVEMNCAETGPLWGLLGMVVVV